MKVELCYQLSWVSSLMTADLGLPRFHNHVSQFLVLYVSVYICIYIQCIFIYTIFTICCMYYKMKYIIFESVSHSVCLTLCNLMDCSLPLSTEFSRQEYWSGQSIPSPRDLNIQYIYRFLLLVLFLWRTQTPGY